MKSRHHRRASLSFVPQLEVLEERAVPAFTVNTVLDTHDAIIGDGFARDAFGNTSLRAAIEEANEGITLTIDFDLPGKSTIATLGALGPFPTLSRDITINGPGAKELTIDADHNYRVFAIDPQCEVTIRDLTIWNGKAPTNEHGGAIVNHGTLNLTDVNLYGNEAKNGGAIINYNFATLVVWHCAISVNTATELGGAIYNAGTAWIQNDSSIDNNTAAQAEASTTVVFTPTSQSTQAP